MKYLMTIKRSWVLSRLAIEMTDEMPLQYTRFNVETWVESAMRYFTSRNFRIVDDGGRVYGYGRSIWAMIDTETRQPTDILAIDNGAINQWIVKDKECPIDKGGRVKMSERSGGRRGEKRGNTESSPISVLITNFTSSSVQTLTGNKYQK